MKGVILAGGTGSRMRPASSVMNKGLIPIFTRENGAIPQMIKF